MTKTEYCVHDLCRKEALYYCGHVKKGKKMILAGWCEEHAGHNGNKIKTMEFGEGGFVKEWESRMGEKEGDI